MAPEKTAEALAALLEQLAQLKQSYERYWQGLERPEPEKERHALRAAFARVRHETDALANVAAQFRLRSAQQSFLAFDQLCERRARAQLETRAPHQHTAATVPTQAALQQAEPLYAQLQAALAARGLPAPSPDKFRRQLEACLSIAQAQAPGQTLHAQLQFDAQQRVQLVVVPALPFGGR